MEGLPVIRPDTVTTREGGAGGYDLVTASATRALLTATTFTAHYPACMFPCQRFTCSLATARA